MVLVVHSLLFSIFPLYEYRKIWYDFHIRQESRILV